MRGYTCSLWTLFHTLTVQAGARPEALDGTGERAHSARALPAPNSMLPDAQQSWLCCVSLGALGSPAQQVEGASSQVSSQAPHGPYSGALVPTASHPCACLAGLQELRAGRARLG